jgi:5-methylcytosine-specific restriction endonuclease McrA
LTKRVPKTRNANTMTEAAYWGMLRSVLRRGFRYWKPIAKARELAKVPYDGENKRQKWAYICASCGGLFKGSEVQVDHIVPCGSLKCPEDIAPFVEKLTAENGYQVLCKSCHTIKTNRERNEEKENTSCDT